MQSFGESISAKSIASKMSLTSKKDYGTSGIMRTIGIICISMIVFGLIISDSDQQRAGSQRRQIVKKYKRPNNLPKPSSRINCPICASDFMSKRLTIDDPCFNPRYNLQTAELELVSECPLSSRNCTTETVYVNGVLTSIKRKCGQPNSCADSCVVAGLGLTSKTCSVCCPPFEYDTYNTDVLKPRECS